MNYLLTAFYILAFIATNVGATTLFKIASDYSGWTMAKYYVYGNLVGIGVPVFLMLALRGHSPAMIYAVCFGGAFMALQIATTMLFKQALSPWQWCGVGVTTLGIMLLQVR